MDWIRGRYNPMAPRRSRDRRNRAAGDAAINAHTPHSMSSILASYSTIQEAYSNKGIIKLGLGNNTASLTGHYN